MGYDTEEASKEHHHFSIVDFCFYDTHEISNELSIYMQEEFGEELATLTALQEAYLSDSHIALKALHGVKGGEVYNSLLAVIKQRNYLVCKIKKALIRKLEVLRDR